MLNNNGVKDVTGCVLDAFFISILKLKKVVATIKTSLFYILSHCRHFYTNLSSCLAAVYIFYLKHCLVVSQILRELLHFAPDFLTSASETYTEKKKESPLKSLIKHRLKENYRFCCPSLKPAYAHMTLNYNSAI